MKKFKFNTEKVNKFTGNPHNSNKIAGTGWGCSCITNCPDFERQAVAIIEELQGEVAALKGSVEALTKIIREMIIGAIDI